MNISGKVRFVTQMIKQKTVRPNVVQGSNPSEVMNAFSAEGLRILSLAKFTTIGIAGLFEVMRYVPGVQETNHANI